MSYQDKSIQCSDCGTTFVFSADEQEAFASRGYTNSPKRCSACREARKTERYGSSGNSGNRDNRYSSQREMYPAVCAQCKQQTQVPFQPRDDRPVYCSACYNKIRVSR